MLCKYCGAKNRKRKKICKKCGKELYPRQCPGCGNVADASGTFCIICGQPLPPVTAAKPVQRKLLRFAVIIFAVIIPAIAGVIVLQFIEISPFKNELMAGFDFDDAAATEIVLSGDDKPEPTINGIAPVSGTVGTKIVINGSNLVSTGLQAVMLDESELNTYTVSEDMVEVLVPFSAVSGNISLVFAEETLDAGAFEVLTQQKQLLAEQTISPSADAQTVSAATISVTIPGNSLEKEQTVKIEQIENPNPINLPESVTGTSFSVTAGDVHNFNDIVLIDYELPPNVSGEPSVAYFDENTSLWDTLPSEVVDGKLFIYTNHLTDFLVFYWGKSIYSSEGYFKIHYQENDKHTYGSSMDDLAQTVGKALEQARKDYNKLPEAYRENFSYLGMSDSMDVYLDSGYGDATYTAMTNNILLPTDFKSIDDLETTSAHELFHANQDTVWNEFAVVGKMGKSENKWAVEALAELAAYELAFPKKERERLLNKGVTSQDPYYTLDNVHEYNMSCFLRYLLRETNSKFEDLWISVASNGKLGLDVCINDFFKSKSSDFISMDMSYMAFWKDVMGNSDAPKHDHPELQFSRRKIYFDKNQHAAIFKYTGKASTTAFNLFAAKSFAENMPIRIFNVECNGSQSTSAMCVNLSGIRNSKELNNLRISGGHSWGHIYADASSGDKQQLYTLEQGKQNMVLIGLESVQPNTLYSVRISEIQAQCKPLKIDSVIPGQEKEFEIAFKDIFSYVKKVEIIIDFGDGTGKKYTNTNKTGNLSGKVTHIFKEITGKEVTVSMYDVSGNERELISKLAMPMTQGEAVTLSANPNPAQLGNSVRFSSNIEKSGFTYKWDFGDGSTVIATQSASAEYLYSNPGTFTASVKVFDDANELLGSAVTTVTVAQPGTTNVAETVTQPEMTTQGADTSQIVGKWHVTSDTYLYYITGNCYYTVATLNLSADGTCWYEYKPILLESVVEEGYEEDEGYRPFDKSKVQEYRDKDRVLNPSNKEPEYEYGKGTWTFDPSWTDAYNNPVGRGTVSLKDFYKPGSDLDEYFHLRDNGQELDFYYITFKK